LTLHRCFAWAERAGETGPDGTRWFPRAFQGEGRHDNPDVYGCVCLVEREVSAVVEQLARFRGQRLVPELLHRRGRPLALAALELPDRGQVIDLDDPAVLAAHELRPSLVATRRRQVTQSRALALYRRHRFAAGLRWWSVFEALWTNVTIFDRAQGRLTVAQVRSLDVDDPAVTEAAELLGLAACSVRDLSGGRPACPLLLVRSRADACSRPQLEG
jgi:hypothetical protein